MRSIGLDPDAVIASVAPVDERFGHTVVEYAFGEIIGRPELDLRTRQLVTVALFRGDRRLRTSVGGAHIGDAASRRHPRRDHRGVDPCHSVRRYPALPARLYVAKRLFAADADRDDSPAPAVRKSA